MSDIYRHLDDTIHLSRLNSWTDEERELVRRSVTDLSYVIRGLVMEHEVNDPGRCRKCDIAWPCPVTESINRLLKEPARAFTDILEHVRELDSSICA